MRPMRRVPDSTTHFSMTRCGRTWARGRCRLRSCLGMRPGPALRPGWPRRIAWSIEGSIFPSNDRQVAQVPYSYPSHQSRVPHLRRVLVLAPKVGYFYLRPFTVLYSPPAQHEMGAPGPSLLGTRERTTSDHFVSIPTRHSATIVVSTQRLVFFRGSRAGSITGRN